MIKGLASSIAFTALFTGSPLTAAPVAPVTYVAEADAKGFVSLYDVSNVVDMPDGFIIGSVVAGDHFPQIFGPVAYQVIKERYHCDKRVIDMADFQEFDSRGKLLDSDHRINPGMLNIIAGKADSEIYNRFCQSGTVKFSPGLPPLATLQARTQYEAYKAGERLLTDGTSMQSR